MINSIYKKIKKLYLKTKLVAINIKDTLFILAESETRKVHIEPFDPKAQTFGKKIQKRVQKKHPWLKVHFVGSLSLGILGHNDIDIIGGTKQENLEKNRKGLIKDFGEPKNSQKAFIEWEWLEKGYKIQLFVADYKNRMYQGYLKMFEVFKNNPKALDRYKKLKLSADGMSVRKYERLRKKLFNESIYEDSIMKLNSLYILGSGKFHLVNLHLIGTSLLKIHKLI